MTDAFGGSRVKVKPPERGVFALDHDGECRSYMKIYLNCLKHNKADQHECKDQSKAYLNCRMETGLMLKEDLSNLGFGEAGNYVRITHDESQGKETKGFIAGLGVKSSNKWKFF